MQAVAPPTYAKSKEPAGSHRARPTKRRASSHHTTSLANALQEADLSDMMTYMRNPLSDENPRFVELKSKDSMTATLAVLAENKVHGAPVYDEDLKKHIGFVDSFDIMAAAVKIFEATGDHAHTEADGETEEAQGRRLQEELMISQLNAAALSDYSHRDPWLVFSSDTSLYDIARGLADPGIQRGGIQDKNGKLIGIVSQSGICEFIFEEHFEMLDHIRDRVKDLDLPKEVLRVREDEEALVAFQLMLEKKVSGLVVVNALGIAIDCISNTDFSLWNEWVAGGCQLRFLSLDKLHAPVLVFLDSTRTQNNHFASCAVHALRHASVSLCSMLCKFLTERIRGSPVTCTSDERLSVVLGRMLEGNVHRCIVIDEAGIPLGVVTFGALLRQFTKATPASVAASAPAAAASASGEAKNE